MGRNNNMIQVIGRLGKDVEVKTFESGSTLCKFSIATNDYYRNTEGEMVTETQWHNVAAWGKIAQRMSTALQKGSEVVIQGKLTYNSYEDKEGNMRYFPEIKASDFVRVSTPAKAPLPF